MFYSSSMTEELLTVSINNDRKVSDHLHKSIWMKSVQSDHVEEGSQLEGKGQNIFLLHQARPHFYFDCKYTIA